MTSYLPRVVLHFKLSTVFKILKATMNVIVISTNISLVSAQASYGKFNDLRLVFKLISSEVLVNISIGVYKCFTKRNVADRNILALDRRMESL